MSSSAPRTRQNFRGSAGRLGIVALFTVLGSGCYCRAPNARMAGSFSVSSVGQPALHPVADVLGLVGGKENLTACLRGPTCPRFDLRMTNIYEDQRDCHTGRAPYCYELALVVQPGRQGPRDRRRICAGDQAMVSVKYRQFQPKRAQQTGRAVRWRGGCIDLSWEGERLTVYLDGVTLDLDTGRQVDLSGDMRLYDPQDRSAC